MIFWFGDEERRGEGRGGEERRGEERKLVDERLQILCFLWIVESLIWYVWMDGR